MGDGGYCSCVLQHAGVPSLDMGFSSGYPVYHSVYDSFEWVKNFGDPSFEFHKTSALLLGSYLIMLADDPVLPFDFTDYADAMLRYETALDEMLTRVSGVDAAPMGGIVNDGFQNYGMPSPGTPPATPHTLDVSRLRNATKRFRETAMAVAAEAKSLSDRTCLQLC